MMVLTDDQQDPRAKLTGTRDNIVRVFGQRCSFVEREMQWLVMDARPSSRPLLYVLLIDIVR
jgi:hypothetical protein